MNMLKTTAAVACLLGTPLATADIYQYEDCDGNGTLLLTELDAEPYIDLSDMYLGCADLPQAILFGADLSGAYLSEANLTEANLTEANLFGAYLTYAILTNANLSGAHLMWADLSYADLSGADLSDATLYFAHLTNANLTNANLSYADLSYAYLSGAYLSYADLSYAYLSYADLSYANLTNADLSYADLSYADLSYAYLSYADLSYADLSYADLSGAYLSYADLSGADLSSVILWESATWGGATYDGETIFPEGMDPDAYGLIFSGPPVTGACCLDDGTCSTLTEENCVDAGGTYNGDNSDCDTASCNIGACCFLKEFCYWECLELSEDDCMAEYAATWYGIGSRCEDIECPDPCLGACCLGGSQCVLTNEALCEAQEGTFHAYKMCDEIECDPEDTCPGDLNGDGDVNILDLLLVINYWGVCL